MYKRYSTDIHHLLLTAALTAGTVLGLTGCRDTDDIAADGSDGITADNVIHVGGISAEGLVATATVTRDGETTEEEDKKTDAEKLDWLRGPLFSGLDITYGKTADRTATSRVAILKLLNATENDGEPKAIKYSDGGLAEYSFKYRDDQNGDPTEIPAVWYDNGSHFFEGLYVPDDIQYDASTKTLDNVHGIGGSAPELTTDQHDDTTEGKLGNYTRLSHYLAMPTGFTLSATVARIMLPFRHRLARVLAYILIDPDMGTDVAINGYDDTTGKDNPTTSDIRFCNVKVLAGVSDNFNATTKHHTFTPQWTQVRKAIPHFVGKRGSYNDDTNTPLNRDHFIAYYNTAKKKYIYPTDAEWSGLASKFSTITESSAAKETSSDKAYERTIYGKVPVYDLIVRPTYTTTGRVMYDEEGVDVASTKTELANNDNKIDFEITLNNGLNYTKEFVFDLDANYQTVVYLHISRERVDYNSSGSSLWQETIGYDDYYGVNNQNGNNLSIAGSGWQRAYTNREQNYGVTDGHYYLHDSEDEYAQYVTDASWIEMLREACVGGKHHGDYFILDHDISIPAAAFPADFVFTGHLDGQDHTITLTGGSYTPARDTYEPYDNAAYTKFVKTGDSYTEFVPQDGETYYQKTGDNEYTAIASMKLYGGAAAYTKSEHVWYTYNPIGLDEIKAPVAGTDYYQQGKDDPIPDISVYISGKVATIYTRNESDVYTRASDVHELNPVTTTYYDANHEPIDNLSTYFGIYTRTSVFTDVYTAINFYKLYHNPGVSGAGSTPTGAYLFSGLNGNYATAQEGSGYTGAWEANVHKEYNSGTPYWVPYKTDTDGWRAEVINLNVVGGTLFKDGATVTGHVRNCWVNGTSYNSTTHQWNGGTKIDDHIPSIPKY